MQFVRGTNCSGSRTRIDLKGATFTFTLVFIAVVFTNQHISTWTLARGRIVRGALRATMLWMTSADNAV